jgi:hypothetical protein
MKFRLKKYFQVKVMDSTSESSSEFSESENAETSVRVDPFRDDPVWNPSLASACDIQGAEGKRTVSYKCSYFSSIFWWKNVCSALLNIFSIDLFQKIFTGAILCHSHTVATCQHHPPPLSQ